VAEVWLVIWVTLGLGSLIALSLVGYRLKKAAERVSRSIDPIDQKLKGLRLEVSALKRSRLDRQRRLEARDYSTTKKGKQ